MPLADVVQAGNIGNRGLKAARHATGGNLGNAIADTYTKTAPKSIKHTAVTITRALSPAKLSTTIDMPDKPYAAACDRNRDPILEILREQFADCHRVLEIGSGTGQHAVYFGAALPHLKWQTSDMRPYHEAIHRWLKDEGTKNVLPPLELDVSGTWPKTQFDAVFSANTLHIMAWKDVQAFFGALPSVLTPGAEVVLYGPFQYDGQHTSASNARFDENLRAQPGDMGIRDAKAVAALARAAGLAAVGDIAMPANNRCLVWRRRQPNRAAAARPTL